jgi:hypothetical protein
VIHVMANRDSPAWPLSRIALKPRPALKGRFLRRVNLQPLSSLGHGNRHRVRRIPPTTSPDRLTLTAWADLESDHRNLGKSHRKREKMNCSSPLQSHSHSSDLALRRRCAHSARQKRPPAAGQAQRDAQAAVRTGPRHDQGTGGSGNPDPGACRRARASNRHGIAPSRIRRRHPGLPPGRVGVRIHQRSARSGPRRARQSR